MNLFKEKFKKQTALISGLILILCAQPCAAQNAVKNGGRARDFGVVIGILPAGKYNAITDVKGVKVGHETLIAGDSVRTGVTAVLPHNGNLFQDKVAGAVYVGNGFGKLAGSTQVMELGEIETPIILTNTLSVGTAVAAVARHMLSLPGNENVRSVNALVGETNDGFLNDIRGQHVTEADVVAAISNASGGAVEEGNAGAGTGTCSFGFKAGIGTSSRKLPEQLGGWTVGVLVQANFGGSLQMNGAPVGRELNRFAFQRAFDDGDGSCMIIIATDAPLGSRNLKRLAFRSFLGLGRTGGFISNGSGDYAIAFSTHPDSRRLVKTDLNTVSGRLLKNEMMSALFLAVVEATEESIINALFAAKDMDGRRGSRAEALPLAQTLEICRKYNVLNWDSKLPPFKNQKQR